MTRKTMVDKCNKCDRTHCNGDVLRDSKGNPYKHVVCPGWIPIDRTTKLMNCVSKVTLMHQPTSADTARLFLKYS